MALRKLEIKKFFQKQLLSSNLEDTIKKTKQEFDIPNDFKITIKLEISFNTNEQKAKEPHLD